MLENDRTQHNNNGNAIETKATSPLSRLVVIVHFGFELYTSPLVFEQNFVRGSIDEHLARHNELFQRLLDFIPQDQTQMTIVMPFDRIRDGNNNIVDSWLAAYQDELAYRQEQGYPSAESLYTQLVAQATEIDPELAIDNIVTVPDMLQKGRRIKQLPDEIASRITSETEIVLCGEWLSACVTSVARALFILYPQISRIIIPQDATLDLIGSDTELLSVTGLENYTITRTDSQIILERDQL